MTFADIQFLEINQEIAAILKLSEIGNVDWQQLLDDIAGVPGNFTVENLTADIETLYNMGASLATAGINGASGALLQQSAFNDLFNGKVSKIIDIYDNYHDLYEQQRTASAAHSLVWWVARTTWQPSSTSPTTTSPRG